MTVKTEYQIGDIVWIFGISPNNKLTKGKIIKLLDLSNQGYQDIHYVVEVPCHIEPLLELRTWQTISQDDKGPIGSFRNFSDIDSTHKLASKVGYSYNQVDSEDPDDPSIEQIHAAIEKSIDNSLHRPLVLKETKPRPRRRTFKKKYKND